MYRPKRVALLLTLVIVLGIASPVALSQEGAPPAEGAERPEEMVAFQDVPSKERQATRAMWTEEELLNAKPLPLLALSEEQREEMELQAYPTGPMGAIPGGSPDSEPVELFDQGFSETDEYAADPIEPLASKYPPPFTRYNLNKSKPLWKRYPQRTVGVLFFKIPKTSGTWRCSGAVAVNRAVWTTGHCVYTPGKGWHTNMVFIPAYRAGNAPYGKWNAKKVAALAGWTDNGNPAYDIGLVIVKDKNGKKIAQRVGWLGVKWNLNGVQHFHAMGYPSEGSFDGKHLYVCAASTSKRDSSFSPKPLGIGCDLTAGISGGPWVYQYQPEYSGNMNYVNGIFSYYYTKRPKEQLSPYFATGAKNLYDWGAKQ